MAITPEKNDVDISSLFYYRKPVTLIGKNAEPTTVYMRLVGDAELQRARVKALRDSRKLRDLLKNPESDEHLAFIPDVTDLSKKKLVEVVLFGSLKEISAEVMKEVKVPFPEELDAEASLEEQESYQKLVDEYPAKRQALVREEIISRTAKEKKVLLKKEVKVLKHEYILSVQNELCEMELTKSFYNHIIFFSLYKDDNYKTSLFEDFALYNDLPMEIKEELLEEYKSLELGMDELKK